MIIEQFFNVVFTSIILLINAIPEIKLDLSGLLTSNPFKDIYLIISYALYFLPAPVVINCFNLIMQYYLLRIIWSIFLRLKSFIFIISGGT